MSPVPNGDQWSITLSVPVITNTPFAELRQRHHQAADRHRGGDGDLLRRQPGGGFRQFARRQRGQGESVADGDLAAQRRVCSTVAIM